jgi:3-oxoacyl-[acyl-carrier-protein] synthase I
MKTRAVVASAGARTALGQTLVETAFLLRTGVTAIAAAPLVDEEGEQVTMCFDPTQDPYVVGEERAAALARPALAEAIAPLSAAAGSAAAQLLLCLDERTARKAAPGGALAAP